MHKEALDS